MSRPDNYSIEKTVWRSGRKNNFGDELVVAEGKVNDKFSYVMAWEVQSKRPECVSWNGTVSWFPRMFWVDDIPPNHIKVCNWPSGKEYYIKKEKNYIEMNGEVYIKFNEDENSHLHHPSFGNAIYNPSAKTKAIEYVEWFNENQRQLDTYGRLLSTSKQAKKRRRARSRKTDK